MSQPIDVLQTLLDKCVQHQASDLHLSGDMPPYARIHGQLQQLSSDSLKAEVMEQIGRLILTDRQRAVFEREQTLDLSITTNAGTTFRVNMFRERGKVALAARRLDDEFRSIEQLHLPPSLREFADLPHGLVLVTGPTGSGKSTTLATLIHEINSHRACHIITVEDPLEYIHKNIHSVVHQRQLYTDVPTFAEAVRSSLREDPDVILIGEMRDLETMRAAITAAETGHLVFSTLHSGDAVGAIDRMVGAFPAEEQESIRQQLSGVLRGVIAQRLLRERTGRGRVPCCEILRVNTAVANLIRRGECQHIHTVMETGGDDGMRLFDHSLAELVALGLVDVAMAREIARDRSVFDSRLRVASANVQKLIAERNAALSKSIPVAKATTASMDEVINAAPVNDSTNNPTVAAHKQGTDATQSKKKGSWLFG